jgi:hypothetical protein
MHRTHRQAIGSKPMRWTHRHGITLVERVRTPLPTRNQSQVHRYPPSPRLVRRRCRTALRLGTCQADAGEWRVLVDGLTSETYFWNIRTVCPDCVSLRLFLRRREVACRLLQGETTWTCPEARIS